MTDNLAKVREALEPFALMAEAIGQTRPSIRTDEDIVYGFEKTHLSLGDFKRARAAYDFLSVPDASSDEKARYEGHDAMLAPAPGRPIEEANAGVPQPEAPKEVPMAMLDAASKVYRIAQTEKQVHFTLCQLVAKYMPGYAVKE